MAEEKYNPIFETFVGKSVNDAELVDLIAYSLYKQAKVEWTLEFKKENGGRKPTDGELTAYYKTWTPVQIEAFRDRAQSSLAAFGASVIEDAKPDILREALRGKFASDVWRGVVAAFCYSVLLIILALVLSYTGVDFLEILHKLQPPGHHA